MSGSAPDEPVVFGTAIQAMRNALKDQVTPALHERLKKSGVDFDKIRPAYPMDTWVEVIRIAGAELFSNEPESTRYVTLGRSFMRGFAETGVGFAAHQLGKLIGVKRTLMRMGRNFRQASNYLETEISDVGEKEVRIRTYTHQKFLARATDRTNLVTDYRRGVLTEVLVLLGAVGTVDIIERSLEKQDSTFRVTWS
ncbi:MAG: DUF2378 family protein [Archangium sp.]